MIELSSIEISHTRSRPLDAFSIEPVTSRASSDEAPWLEDLVALARSLSAPAGGTCGLAPPLIVRRSERWRSAAVRARLRALAQAVGFVDGPAIVSAEREELARGWRPRFGSHPADRAQVPVVAWWGPPSPAGLAAALTSRRSLIVVTRPEEAAHAARVLELVQRARSEGARLETVAGASRRSQPNAMGGALADLIELVIVAARTGAELVHYPMAGPAYLGLDGSVTAGNASPAALVHELSGLLTLLEVPVAIENPCVGMTTEEILRTIAVHGGVGALAHTTSCAHTVGRATGAHDPGARVRLHCGSCVACAERRAAALNLELERADPIEAYAVDPLLGPLAGPASEGLLRLPESLRQLDAGPAAEREHVLSWSSAAAQLPGDFAANLDLAVRLCRRRAGELSRAFDMALARNLRALRNGELPRQSLLVEAVLGAYRDRPAPSPTHPMLRRAGDLWEARFGGTSSTFVPSARGLEYLRELLVRPHVALSALELRDLRAGVRSSATMDVATTADAQALAAYRRRLLALCELRRAADADGDLGRLARIDAETAHLEQELSRARGLGGRPRSSGDAERARKAITNAIRASIALLHRHLPELAVHLATTIHTGRHLSYEPPSDLEWET